MMRNKHTQSSSHHGFTLVESVVALFVLMVGILGMYTMHITSIDGNGRAARITKGTTWITDQIEDLINLPYDDILLSDRDLDGKAISGEAGDNDANDDGVDDGGNDFGLSDMGVAADHTLISADGSYTLFWNVSEEQLMPDLKTIRVIAQYNDKGQQETLVMDYVKPKM